MKSESLHGTSSEILNLKNAPSTAKSMIFQNIMQGEPKSNALLPLKGLKVLGNDTSTYFISLPNESSGRLYW